MRRAIVAVLLTFVIAACTLAGAPPTSTPAASSTFSLSTTTTSLPPSTSTTLDPQVEVQDECGETEGEFTDGGVVGTGGAEDSDAAVIQSFSWSQVGACERLEVGFATLEGAPAVEPPSVAVQFFRWTGVIRLAFGAGVTEAVIGEQLVDTPAVGRLYTVTQVDNTMFVDIHLREPVFARSFTTTGPATVVVDITPGGQAYPDPAQRSGEIVALTPDPEALSYPVTVPGYALDAGPSIGGSLRTPDGSVVFGEAAVGPSDFTWGGFSMVFPDGPPGNATIQLDDGPTLEVTLP